MTQLAHKIRLYPSSEAEAYFRRAAGTARFAWNWALARWKELYENGERGMSGYGLVKDFNARKAAEFPWTSEVTKWAPQKAIQDLGDAFRRFFRKLARYPRFKKKGVSKDKFYLGSGTFTVKGKYIRIAKLGWVRMAQELRFPGKLKHAVISRDADGWYAAISVEIDEAQWTYPHLCETQAAVGIDLGLSSTMTLSDGAKLCLPRSLEVLARKIRRTQKALSRRAKGSRNREKAKQALALLWLRVRRVHHDWTHQATSRLVQAYRLIGLEDLNVKGMMKNHCLARRIGEACWGELRRQLGYKTGLAGGHLVLANRFFPSSKRCSSCGEVLDELPLSVRSWTCPACGALHDRDVNAALNLKLVARRHRETQNACGEDVSPGIVPGSLVEAGIGIGC